MSLVVALACWPGAAHASFPGANGKIAYYGVTGIRVMNADGSGDVALTTGEWPAWSPDGTKIAFQDSGPSTPGCDGPSTPPCNQEIYVINADGTGRTRLTFTTEAVEALEGAPSWSPDGTRIAFTRYERTGYSAYTMRADGTDEQPLPFAPAVKTIAWSPDGTRLAYGQQSGSLPHLYSANLDGSGVINLCCTDTAEYAHAADWAPDGHALVFHHGNAPGSIMRVNADGTGLTILRDNSDDLDPPIWSPDGTKILFASYPTGTTQRALFLMNTDGSGVHQISSSQARHPSWQPIPQTYVRPKGATPLSLPLVIAYTECTSSDTMHGQPLSFPSCTRAIGAGVESPYVTVGTPDSNGAAANFKGSVRLDVRLGDPATPADEADVGVRVLTTDIRCTPATPPAACGAGNFYDGPDYVGELEGRLALRITDKDNAPSANGAATVSDTTLSFAVPCAATGDEAQGSACDTTTSVEALVPGAVKEGKRAMWQVGKVEVYDGGPDADADTGSNAPFLRQGIFVP